MNTTSKFLQIINFQKISPRTKARFLKLPKYLFSCCLPLGVYISNNVGTLGKGGKEKMTVKKAIKIFHSLGIYTQSIEKIKQLLDLIS